MSNTFTHFGAVLPTLILLSLGIGLRKVMRFEEGFWSGLERLVYWVFFPLLLMDTTIRAPLSHSHWWLIVLSVAIMGVGIAYSWLGIYFSHAPERTRQAIFQCGFRFNTYIGIAMISAGFGANGVSLFALMAGVCVPIANIAAISALSVGRGVSIGKEIARNPLVIGTLAGIIGNLLGIRWTPVIDETFALISKSAIVLGLIAVGAALHFESLGYYRKLNVYFLLTKLILVPLTTLFLLKFVFPPLAPEVYPIVMIFASLPTASTAFILAMRLGGDGKTVALQITLGSMLSMVTTPIWITLTHQLFPF